MTEIGEESTEQVASAEPSDIAEDITSAVDSSKFEIEPLGVHHALELYNVLSECALHEHIDSTPPQNPEQTKRWIEAVSRGPSEGSNEVWLNWVILQDQRVLGYVQSTVYPEEREAELAFMLSQKHWGTGASMTAAQLMIAELLDNWPIVSLFATTEEANVRCQGLLYKLGFELASHHDSEIEFRKRV